MAELRLFWISMWSNSLSSGFAIVMTVFFFIVFLNKILPSLSKIALIGGLPRLYRKNPNILMNVGILGTFFGICIALLNFDPTDIDASVPGLLSGMKLAFTTSVWGVTLSILLHFFDSLSKDKNTVAATSPVETLVEEMQETRKAIVEGFDRVEQTSDEAARQQAEQNAHTVDALEKLQKSLVGEDDASLATRLLHMRQDANDGRKNMEKLLTDSFDGIRAELAQFGKTLAESNSKALLEALREVVSDLNNQLTEQFGENFKELNRAVGDLLTWQEYYRESVGEMQSQFQRCLEGVARCEESLSSIRNHAESIPSTMETLSEILQGLQQQNTQANALLESFAHMRERAGEALPVIQKELIAITDGLSKSVQETGQKVAAFTVDATESMKSAVEDQNKAVRDLTFNQTEALKQASIKHAEDLKAATEVMADQLNAMVTRIGSGLTSSVTETVNGMNEATEKITSTVTSVSDNLKSSTKLFADTLGESVERSTDDMATISRQVQEAVKENSRKLELAIEQALKTTQEVMNKQFSAFDSTMEQELQKAISQLGSHLASLSEKFVEDYTPLTERLAEVVRISEAIGAGSRGGSGSGRY